MEPNDPSSSSDAFATSDQNESAITEIDNESSAFLEAENDDVDKKLHAIPMDFLLRYLESDLDNGLTTEEAAIRLKKNGPNRLTPPRPIPTIVQFLDHCTEGFSILLLIGSALSFFTYLIQSSDSTNLFVGLILLAVVLITATFEQFQDSKASRVMEKFKGMMPKKSSVLRNGKWVMIDPETIVIGDIVDLSIGNLVPADVRVCQASNLKVENSSLTGETEPQPRSIECTSPIMLESRNVAFYTTSIIDGKGFGIVISTGDNTIIGGIVRLASDTSGMQTQVRREVNHVVKIVTVFALFSGTIFFFVGILFYPIISTVIFTIALIVGNVPTGLLATVTLCLTLSAKRLAKRKVIVKNLESVETLGSTSVICSDKTGTLTQNKMTLVHLWIDNQVHTTNTLSTSADYNEESKAFRAMYRSCALCSNAAFENSEEEDAGIPTLARATSGDASESALVKFAHDVFPIDKFRESNPRIAEVSFNSTNKYHLSINKIKGNNGFVILMKGAPERIISRCSKILINDEELNLDDEWKKCFQDAYDQLGGLGERVIGHCYRIIDDYPDDYTFNPDDPNFPTDGMTFLGLTALIDPPRPSVPSAVLTCKTAGVKVIMVTGDHPITAKAIARQVNILQKEEITADTAAEEKGIDIGSFVLSEEADNYEAIAVSGSQLLELSDDQLSRILDYPRIVFARTSPEQKLRIVMACQKKGSIVAVTGDGVNDSPALKKANIGVAMGSGSPVSHEAADMIITDDNFSTIVNGVEEGRLIYDNLRKTLAFTITHNVPEFGPLILYIAIQLPPPVSTYLLLFVDLATDLVTATSLAYELPEDNLMKRSPRDISERLVNSRMVAYAYLTHGPLIFLGAMYAFFVCMGDFGFPPYSLVGKSLDWQNDAAHNGTYVFDGRSYTYDQRTNALDNAQTAYWVGLLIGQFADGLSCKTRLSSIFTHGLRNRAHTYAVIWNILFILFIVYVPFINSIVNSAPLSPRHFLPAFPFALLFFWMEELRKWVIRRNPRGFIARTTLF